MYNAYRMQQSDVMQAPHSSVLSSIMYSIDKCAGIPDLSKLAAVPKREGERRQAICNAYIVCTPSQMQTSHGVYGNKMHTAKRKSYGSGAISYHRGEDIPSILLRPTAASLKGTREL